LSTVDGKNVFASVKGQLKFQPTKSVAKHDASFFAGKGLMHRGISLMPDGKKGYFVAHDKKVVNKKEHYIHV